MTPRARAPRRVSEGRPVVPYRRLLLDTQVWLWWQMDDRRLGRRAREVIAGAAEVWLSAASAWEIVIKSGLGKLTVPRGDIGAELARDGFRPLPVEVAHAQTVRALAPVHRDPFDRMLVAQALHEGLTLMTADSVLARYGVPLVSANA